MRRPSITLVLTLAVLGLGCGTPAGTPTTSTDGSTVPPSSTSTTTSSSTTVPNDSPEAVALADAESRWVATGATSYRFTLVRSCYCLDEWIGPFDVTVVDGIASVTRLGLAVDPTIAAELPLTAELLFAHLRAHLDDADYRATFDTATGFPLSFWSDPIPEAADDELGLDTSTLQLG